MGGTTRSLVYPSVGGKDEGASSSSRFTALRSNARFFDSRRRRSKIQRIPTTATKKTTPPTTPPAIAPALERLDVDGAGLVDGSWSTGLLGVALGCAVVVVVVEVAALLVASVIRPI